MNKLEIIANRGKPFENTKIGLDAEDQACNDNYVEGFKKGFKSAFIEINECIAKEMQLLEKYPFMGERLVSLKIYSKKVNEVLTKMEEEL